MVEQSRITCERSARAYHYGYSLQCGGLHHDGHCVACRDVEPELEQDDAQLEHGDVLLACACEHSVNHELCCDRPCRLRTPSDVH